jgi:hypothetical protein
MKLNCMLLYAAPVHAFVVAAQFGFLLSGSVSQMKSQELLQGDSGGQVVPLLSPSNVCRKPK